MRICTQGTIELVLHLNTDRMWHVCMCAHCTMTIALYFNADRMLSVGMCTQGTIAIVLQWNIDRMWIAFVLRVQVNGPSANATRLCCVQVWSKLPLNFDQ